MAVDPARVWKALLEPTLDEVFDMPKGGKGTAANIWGDVFIQNDALHDRMRKDGQGDSSRYSNSRIIGQMIIQGKGTRMHFNGQEAKKPMAESLHA